MAATEKKQIWQWSGKTPKIREFPIATTQGIYMAGSPCYLTTSGTVKLQVTTSGAGEGFLGFLCEGVAAQLAANTKVKVALADKDSVYAIYCESGGADAAMTQAYVGNKYGFTISATTGHIGYATLKLDSGSTNVIPLVVDAAFNVSDAYSSSDAAGVALVKIPVTNLQATDT